jgi:Plasmid pRiA4b ORF-3-like protein
MAFQFKIQLKNITDPPVWRRLLVPEQFTFLRMHRVIQVAFGWEDYHLFQFSPKGYASHPLIGMPDPEMGDTQDAQKIKLSEIFTTPKQKFIYIYDFGDDWFHQISLEKITDDKLLRASCMAGIGACPPEDCGGPYGYENLKLILNDPKDPEHAGMKEWLGMTKKEKWDAAFFDLEKTKVLVAKV